MKAWQILLMGILIGLLAAGVVLLVSRQPTGHSIELIPAPTLAPLTVHITGAVVNPGVYSLPRGSRVQDALTAAGGFSTQASPDAVNLAAFLQDGQQIHVPAVGEQVPVYLPGAPTGSSVAPVDINTADEAELQTLPGIGPTRAQAILAYRQEHGPFLSIADIRNVPGIGETTYQQIKDLIVVGGTP
jgi:competence protein ComEA